MDWNMLISTIAIVAFMLLMMRGCGGMMAGRGCGMGASHRQRRHATAPGESAEHGGHESEAR